MADVDWASAVEQQEQGTSTSNKRSESAAAASDISSQVQSLSIGSTGATASASSSASSAAGSTQNGEAHAKNGPSEDGDKVTADEQSLLRKLIRTKLSTTRADLEIIQKDPNSPLYSVKTFEALNLRKEILDGVYSMGFNAPSKIQETALPTLLADPPANMIAQSQSGTGKTAAFVLTMLSRVDLSQNYPQCLCLAPTYELALQIGKNTEDLAKHLKGIRIGYAVRGEKIPRGQKVDYHIVIGTPGTMLDWCLKLKAVDMRKINVFVLDEADVMIAQQGHQDSCIRIQRQLRKDCQMLLFSATYEEDVMKFAEAVIPHPVVIKLRKDEESLDNIKQFYIECADQEGKFSALSNIYGSISIGQSMIFCATRKTASWLAEKMTKDGHAVALLSGDLTIEQRAAVINRFREGKEKVLITTNVTARGIDVEQVTVVVNFDLPLTHDFKPDCETYLHRIGRTGRFGKNGLAINMIDGTRSYKTLQVFERHFGRQIMRLDADDMDEIEKIGT